MLPWISWGSTFFSWSVSDTFSRSRRSQSEPAPAQTQPLPGGSVHPETLIAILEQTADPRRAADWDCCGVQIAGTRNPIRRLAVSLDPLESTIRTALDWNADFILTHHPLTLAPRLPDRQDWYRQILKTVLGSDVWLYAAHTSLDVQTRGPVSWLARSLELEDVKPVLDTTPVSYGADLSNLKVVPENIETLSSSQGLKLIQDPQGRSGLCFEQAQRDSEIGRAHV